MLTQTDTRGCECPSHSNNNSN